MRGELHMKAHQESWIKYSKYSYKWILELPPPKRKCKSLEAKIHDSLPLYQVVSCHWSKAIKRAVGYLSVKFRDIKMWKRNILKSLYFFFLEVHTHIKSIKKCKRMINIKGIQDSDYFWSVRGESSWPSTVLVIHYFAEWLIYGHSLYFSLYIYFIFEIFHKNEERNLLMPLSQRRDAGGRRDLCSKISLGEYLIYGQRRSQRRRG